jgi:hypothetical protein
MSKTARQGASGYRPSGRQCVECKHAADDCSGIDFAAMPQAGKIDKDGVQRVACMFYERAERVSAADELCQECGGRGWHKLSCSQRTDRAPQYPATRDAGGVVTVCRQACRCGPDGCADSECLGRPIGEVA